jgi:hypothetical protein
MARNGMLREGDVWRYSRTFYGVVTIKKELIVRILESNLIYSAPGSTNSHLH